MLFSHCEEELLVEAPGKGLAALSIVHIELFYCTKIQLGHLNAWQGEEEKGGPPFNANQSNICDMTPAQSLIFLVRLMLRLDSRCVAGGFTEAVSD